MKSLKTLLVQSRLACNDPGRNLKHLGSLLASAQPDFDLVVLPETFTTGFLGDSDLPDEGMDGPGVQWMAERAVEYDCAVAGSLVIVEDGHRFNRLIFMTPEGLAAYYDKRHLFTYGGEDERYTAGSDRVILEHKGWRINLQVCYDLRFPAWCRNRDDYDLMLLVANWPSRRVRHWSALLEARAIENQSWVIGVNRVGEDENGIIYPGASVVHDPRGSCIADLGDEECCRLVEMDLAEVDRVRAQFPFQADADRFTLE